MKITTRVLKSSEMGPHLVLIFLERYFSTIIMLFVLESSEHDFVFECTVSIVGSLEEFKTFLDVKGRLF